HASPRSRCFEHGPGLFRRVPRSFDLSAELSLLHLELLPLEANTDALSGQASHILIGRYEAELSSVTDLGVLIAVRKRLTEPDPSFESVETSTRDLPGLLRQNLLDLFAFTFAELGEFTIVESDGVTREKRLSLPA